MDTSSCPFLISPEVSVPPGTVVCMSAGVVAEMDGMIVGELEFSTFAFIVVGILHPATTKHATTMRRVRGMIIFRGIRIFFLENEPFTLLISMEF